LVGVVGVGGVRVVPKELDARSKKRTAFVTKTMYL